jgi:FkbM family methyltransferase
MLSFKKAFTPSYSQCGEDLIVEFVLKNNLKVKNINYLDIGTNHPVKFNNTYKFYQQGSTGVLVEPDYDLFTILKNKRPKDITLNAGVDKKERELDFYLLEPDTLNTFSIKEVEQYKKFYNAKVRNVVKVPTININNILKKYFNKTLDFLSIDVEGLDYAIVSSIDFDKIRPKVICVESMIYEKNNVLKKSKKIKNLLYSKGYFMYADTFVNSIYVDAILWKKMKQPKLLNMGN